MIAKTQKTYNCPPSTSAQEKERQLRSRMREMGSVLVAYSGGVDSSYLALIATQELGANALCLMGISPSVSEFQREEALRTAGEFSFNFRTIDTSELENPAYRANPENRCYFCKTELYGKLLKLKVDLGVNGLVDGTNADDIADQRPGRIAALEKNVRSPLAETGLTKDDVRQLSRIHGLTTWDKPASPCLASRVAYGVPVTIARLGKVERGEEFLRGLGFREFRVRVHGDLVRIEISPNELETALQLKMSVKFADAFKKLGFKYVTLDLEGFRSGALNAISTKVQSQEIINQNQRLERV